MNIRLRSVLLLLQLLGVSSFVQAQRRGGGGGGGGGGGDDDDDYEPPDIDPITPPPSSGGGGGGGFEDSTRPCGGLGECGCQQYKWRHALYGLPGVYYNGTLNIAHSIEDNTVWDMEEPDESTAAFPRECPNDDRSIKQYSYPALLHLGPRGNDTDENPLHWSLKAFQPGNQTEDVDGPYIDILQRWVHIRSSDFVLGDKPYMGYIDRYQETDSTNSHETTRSYWETEVADNSDSGSGSSGRNLSVRAVYENEQPVTSFWGSSSRTGVEVDPERDIAKGQYVTLSDVCDYRLDWANRASGSIPRSQIPYGNDYDDTTTPTLWLRKGATARMDGVGTDTATFVLQTTLESAVPRVGERTAECSESAMVDLFEANRFDYLEPWSSSEGEGPWNITVKIRLSFEGDLVGENSTEITGLEDGEVKFAAGFEYPEEARASPSPGSGGSDNAAFGTSELVRRTLMTWASLSMVFGAVLCIL